LEYKQVQDFVEFNICLDIFQSVFVVFEKERASKNQSRQVAANHGQVSGWLWQHPDALNVVKTESLDDNWTVQFDPNWGGPESAVFTKLVDWSQHKDKRIRYYAGKALYSKRFDFQYGVVEADTERQPLFLDLGVVNDIASVKLNGYSLGIVWTAPWRVDITGLLQNKDNLLEIEVINQWPNRLIGDAALPKEQRLTNTNIAFKKDAPLLPSGLLGPVRILRRTNNLKS
ncbi:MAG TPA: hypothetical protein VL053_00880, partial [Arachidicoccus sp.]|nr:hypothetical protein [Arachidicoccus sp.]